MKPESYWEEAGRIGYANQYYVSDTVGSYLTRRIGDLAIATAKQLKLTEESTVLDLGCGDGTFANGVLARHFKRVKGMDLSEAGIRRAKANAPRSDVHFEVCDLRNADLRQFGSYDAVFLIGILHHVKSHAPRILSELRSVTTRLVVMEPNGGHIVRKLLEYTPSYRAAGEESFRTRELESVFSKVGFQKASWLRFNLFPNFTPLPLFKLMLPLQPYIEQSAWLRALCTANIWGLTADA